METDSNKMYDAIIKLNRKIAELEQRNMEVENILSSFNPAAESEESKAIVEQETTLTDPFNLEARKNVSLPNGGVIRMKSKPLCVNGRHVINNEDTVAFCSKCSAIMCDRHLYDLDQPVCMNCLKEEIKDFDSNSLYLLFAIKNNVPVYRLRRRLNISSEDMKAAISLLESKNCITQDIIFRRHINIYGENVLNTAMLLYDFSFLEPLYVK